MEHHVHDRIRRGVRAAVYRACWRRLEGDEDSAKAVLATEVPAALAESPTPLSANDPSVVAWIEQDHADFDRAVLISDLVARRSCEIATVRVRSEPAATARPLEPMAEPGPRRPAAGAPLEIADLLDGMLAQDRKLRAAS